MALHKRHRTVKYVMTLFNLIKVKTEVERQISRVLKHQSIYPPLKQKLDAIEYSLNDYEKSEAEVVKYLQQFNIDIEAFTDSLISLRENYGIDIERLPEKSNTEINHFNTFLSSVLQVIVELKRTFDNETLHRKTQDIIMELYGDFYIAINNQEPIPENNKTQKEYQDEINALEKSIKAETDIQQQILDNLNFGD